MNAKKILLAFDGSAQSLNAAELCWALAAKHPVSLTAQHVINSVGLWQFLNFEVPGLTGSGPYLAAHEAMGKELRSIGETLVAIYQTKAKTHGLDDQCVLDEGDAIDEILRRSKDNDMVVIGHHPYTAPPNGSMGQGGQAPRYLNHCSMAEALAQVIDKPLLVVQAQCLPWQGLKLILHGTEGIEASFRAAADFAAYLNLPLNVITYFHGDETVQDLPDLTDLIKETGRLHPDLELKAGRAKLWPTDGDDHMAAVDCPEDYLVMVPTFASAEQRNSIFGTAPDLLVRNSTRASLLLWPAGERSLECNLELPVAALSK